MSNKAKILLMSLLSLGISLMLWDMPKTEKAQPEPNVKVNTAPPNTVQLTDSEWREQFIKRFAPIAVSESKKFKIPASVILSVAASNSEWYDHPSHHNLFKLQPDEGWEGQAIEYRGELPIKKYGTAWESFRDFSKTVSTISHETSNLDTEQWVQLLSNYNLCDPRQPLDIIKRYNLTELDK